MSRKLIAADDRGIAAALETLALGGVIIMPTDTVYGVAASLAHPSAISRLYDVKRRNLDKPIPVLISDDDVLDEISPRITPTARTLADCFWPGALTLVVEAGEAIPREALAGGSTVGIRLPDSDVCRTVIRGAGGNLAVTSANTSGDREARTAAEALEALGNEVDLILDGGPAPGGRPSTVVDVTGQHVIVLREGAIPRQTIDDCARMQRSGARFE